MELEQKLEAVLFFKGEPMKVDELSEILEVSDVNIREAANKLRESLKGRGLVLVEKEKAYALRTSSEVSEIIAKIKEEELTREIGKAGLETISVLLYKGPSTRAEIDYIRGVNSTFILRTLMIRGLVERVSNPKDARSFLYKPTFDLLTFLGISRIEELPNYADIKLEIENFEDRLDEETENGEHTHTA
ncbi:MAG: SMC-Scp complex subunit ScpB [Candidatus Pacebacteria bacterium]|jgi:segregation and condensation protein B|nr:hypothetical protein [bacterium]MDP6527752.1 SMC-Scp complex subunit ScpB [Candidatus Paceibacterota bacterium]MDP6659589.1 SMC-Scp complex subunit ScpB [Candidatus Paceibacterota bacterium]|tara:strand:- start:22433 stop:22999 length:567 start_codon:yes stop_codon:yes gene_type:complete